ncbi:Gfo/Idh/MocA family protein [Bacillus tuaregi]|uniref:Gfo/Idh/MocA family protein n=1 Tax=Bacillus tuaregi TaxID=1816695 RepID=UPI0008F896EF|nr:Gfo/Idh/MocA family oxidoreductase [Bacillus tuaregi]
MIRFGIIGTNWITDSFIEAAMELEDFSISAIYSRTEEKAAEFAQKYGVDRTFTDLEEMAKSNVIDAVYIASPNSFHAKQAIQFMKHKKHVLCEKPLASNSVEVKEMIQMAKENNVLLMEALKTTLMPNFKAIQENLHKVGAIRRFVASYCQYSSRYDAYKEGTILNAFNPAYSNGSIMDIGIYCIYPLVVLFGKPTSIKASGYILESGVDGEGSLLLSYPEMEAVLMFSKITDSALPSEIQGEDGSIVMKKLNPIENVEIHYRNGEIENVSKPQKKHPMFYEAEEFINLIQAGEYESKVNSYDHSFITAEIIEEARKQMGVKFG